MANRLRVESPRGASKKGEEKACAPGLQRVRLTMQDCVGCVAARTRPRAGEDPGQRPGNPLERQVAGNLRK